MDAKDTLGILVNSNRYFSFVTKMADAAIGKGKQVRICLLGTGIAYAETKAFTRLSRSVHISLCAQNERRCAGPEQERAGGLHFVSPQEMTAVLESCGRYVVF